VDAGSHPRVSQGMRWKSYLQLGRVSNLPTVWTNVMAGGVLAGAVLDARMLLGPVLAGSAMYVGGMFLNDAFDREIDRRERPERPIPAGRVTAGEVFAIGFALLIGGWLLFALHVEGWGYGGRGALVAGAALAGAIVLYDLWHKGNPWSPVLMGLCRALLYGTAGYAMVAQPRWELAIGAVVLLCYLIGLTYVAKQETLTTLPNFWPIAFLATPFVYAAPTLWSSATGGVLYLLFVAWVAYALRMLIRREAIGRAVVSLIAGIALLDAVLIAGQGMTGTAWLAAACFPLTLALQRYVAGT
jgi:hypothetical protein